MQMVIQAGAHFTDEAQLFSLLQANTQIMADNHTAFWGLRPFRKIFRPALKPSADRPSHQDTLAQFQNLFPKGQQIDRAILSSALYLGERSSIIMDGQFYARAGQRMAYLDQLFGESTVELFIGLRNPGSFIPNVLMLLSAHEREHILATTDLSCLSWLAMIEDIRDLAPDVKITLWSNEDFPLICGDILRTLAGMPDDTPIEEEFTLLSSLVSDVGKRELADVIEQQSVPNDPILRGKLGQIFQQHALTDAIEEELELPGWNEDIVAAFTELYEQDLARLQTMPDIRFLKP
ncbi:hypothetical protein SAMN05444358_101123 [Ruegeria halocynthiae]|uniref:Uncharacterized protein n=1 Tax=Ruegeria halocynthiae TaxID=985054 RepID=A0A1H2RDM4_9RHOB|nr:hypothetical protein [Ruegeria halocynthiae]SDW17405.1 hypothetical protein SAMN05444358_101123 [Ruegeria halocynthiae]